VLVKKFKISQHLAELQARKLIASRAQCVWALSCWKIKNSADILSTVWQETTVVDCCYIDFDLAWIMIKLVLTDFVLSNQFIGDW